MRAAHARRAARMLEFIMAEPGLPVGPAAFADGVRVPLMLTAKEEQA